MTEYGLTTTGYVPRRAADWLSIVRTEFEALTGLTIAWDRDEVLGNWSVMVADRLAELDESVQSIYDGRDLANSVNIQLGNLCALVGVRRIAATYSTAVVTCSGTTGTIIDAGDLVEGGGPDDDQRWEALAAGTIGAGGTVDILFQATTKGEITAAIGEIDRVVTSRDGWTGATNAADASPGVDRETDAELRLRRQQSIANSGSGNSAAIRAVLLALDGVTAASVVSNRTGASIVVGSFTLVEHSMLAILWPNTLTTTQEEAVAEAIYERIFPGVQTNGTQVYNVTQPDGFTEAIRFEYAAEISTDVRVTVVLKTGVALSDVQTTIEEIVTEHFDILAPGDDLFDLPIESRIGVDLSAYLSRAEVQFNIGSGWADSVTIAATDIATEGTTTVTV